MSANGIAQDVLAAGTVENPRSLFGAGSSTEGKIVVEFVGAVADLRGVDAGLELLEGAMVLGQNAGRLRKKLCRFLGGSRWNGCLSDQIDLVGG